MPVPFEYTFPYTSRRMPIMARNCVATSQPLAAQAGLDMLRVGGNAIDAAVATAVTLSVVEPTSNGIGSDGFALIWTGGGLHGLNASGRSARAMPSGHFRGQDSISTRGWDGVTTPGVVSGWIEAHKQFGSLPLERIFAPAIHYARDGFYASPITATYWARGVRGYDRERFPDWHSTFAPTDAAPKAGELVKFPDHADTLEEIARTAGESFYRGALAERIARAAIDGGGFLRAEDLATHKPEWVRPISVDYRGWILNEIPPNGQGLAALLMLGILRHHEIGKLGVDSPESMHLQIEAMKLAFADGHRYIADPDFMDVDVTQLLDDSYLESRAALIDPSSAQDFDHGVPKPGGTIYLTAADDQGNMVSWIQSNYGGFGSGIVIPGTGISLQNRGCCFTTEEGHPNEAAPGKRPYHTIIPGFVTRRTQGGDEAPVMSFGVMGGFMQPQGHAQVVIRMGDYRQNPQAALDAPRWQVTEGKKVTIEPGLKRDVYDRLGEMGHEVTVSRRRTASHGRGQIIYKLDDGGYVAASDLRADGQAVGY